MNTNPSNLGMLIRQKAKELGFTLVGFADAAKSPNADYVKQWIEQGSHGEMKWLERRLDERLDPQVYFPGCKSVISLAANYRQDVCRDNQPGQIAQYALFDDYHDILKDKLHQLADYIRQIVPEAQTKVACDTAPVLEREIAANAGLGWVGKNTCLIHPELGSFLFLAEVLTTLELPPDRVMPDRCGTCTRCIDACPTRAIEPYRLNASKCISYWTIELKQPAGAEKMKQASPWLYGCDICQDVCPWNGKAVFAEMPEILAKIPARIDPREVQRWNTENYAQLVRKTPVKRVKLEIFKENARGLL